MKFKLFIAVFIFLFAVLAIGFFTEKTADDDSSDYDDDSVEEASVEGDIEEEKPALSDEKKVVEPDEEKIEVADETTDIDQTEVSDKQQDDADVTVTTTAVDADSETETVDSDSDATVVACEFENTRYVPCDHVQGKIQKQLCNASKVWEDENECFSKPATTEMISLSSGSFWMGSPTSENGRNQDEARHYVSLGASYSVGKYEVTQGLFNAVLGYNPSHFKKCGDKCPVEMVSWHEALKYANELSKIEGLSPCFTCSGVGTSVACALKKEYATPQDCSGYRLPTEAEWEGAARAGTTTAFYNRRDLNSGGEGASLAPIGWYMNNSSATYEGGTDCRDWFDGADKCGTQQAGTKVANDSDIYDMSGNVEEWVMDVYTKEYDEGTEAEPVGDPYNATGGSGRVQRGGAWSSRAAACRSASRGHTSTSSRSNKVGFRLAKTE